jgi:hypothetical protein
MFRRGIMVLLVLVLALMTATVALADGEPGGGDSTQPYNNEWTS